jgi:hypothetical protein
MLKSKLSQLEFSVIVHAAIAGWMTLTVAAEASQTVSAFASGNHSRKG